MADRPQTPPGLPASAQALFDAVVAISSNLDRYRVLDRIVQSACELTGARYGALGVVGPDGQLADFITHGVDEDLRHRIGDLPRGRGILRLLIDRPEPLRLSRLQDHPQSYGFPPNHPAMRSFLGVPVRIRGTVFGNLYLTEKRPDASGDGFTAQDEQLVLALATTAGFVIENSRAYDRSERQRTWLEAAARLTDELQPPLDAPAALQLVASTVLAAGRLAAVGVYRGPPGQPVALVGQDGRRQDLLSAVAEQVHDRLQQAAAGRAVEDTQIGPDHRALLLPVPTRLFGPVAVLAVVETRYPDVRIPASDRELLTSFADQVALTLDRVQAVADRAELAVVSDRERIARDLHDLVIQRLFATGLQLQGIRRASVAPDLRERVDRAVAELDTTIREIRSTIFDLQHRDQDSVRGALRRLLAEYQPVLGFEPALRLNGPVETAADASVREHLLAVVRESLSNVARHADAGHAEVAVSVVGHELVVVVTDDGVGVPVRPRESGLRNVRDRASGLGGSVRLARCEPHGTILEWRVPIGSGLS